MPKKYSNTGCHCWDVILTSQVCNSVIQLNTMMKQANWAFQLAVKFRYIWLLLG